MFTVEQESDYRRLINELDLKRTRAMSAHNHYAQTIVNLSVATKDATPSIKNAVSELINAYQILSAADSAHTDALNAVHRNHITRIDAVTATLKTSGR